MRPLIITLDGPAGSGKSTVARELARRLGLEFLDTGAMYRGLTAVALDERVDPAERSDAVVELARRSRLRFDWHADPPRLHVELRGDPSLDRDLTDRLRDADVTSRVSELSAIPGVRQVMVDIQRHIGQQHPRLVTEGRDQGSVVFPHAQVKFYLDASPDVRARRRAEQLRQAGKPADEAQIREQIVGRDRRDSARKEGPLVCPHDAIRIDTSEMSLDQVVDHLERLARQRLEALGSPVREAR